MKFQAFSIEKITRLVAPKWRSPAASTHSDKDVAGGRSHEMVPEECKHPNNHIDDIRKLGREASGIKEASTNSDCGMHISPEKSSCVDVVEGSSSCGVGAVTSTVPPCVNSEPNAVRTYSGEASSRRDFVLNTLFCRAGQDGQGVDGVGQVSEFPINAKFKPPTPKEILWHVSRKQRRITTPTCLDGDITCPGLHDVLPDSVDDLTFDIGGTAAPSPRRATYATEDPVTTNLASDTSTAEASSCSCVIQKEFGVGRGDDASTVAPEFESETNVSELGPSQASSRASIALSTASGVGSRSTLVCKQGRRSAWHVSL